MSVAKGHCLCGAVTVQVTDLPDELSACHCELCTRWGGGVQMGIEVPLAALTVAGPVKRHRSSELADRAWCDTCGSSLFLAGHGEDVVWLSPGLFDNAGGAELVSVVYADRHPDGFWLEGARVERVSQQDYEADNPHLNEEC